MLPALAPARFSAAENVLPPIVIERPRPPLEAAADAACRLSFSLSCIFTAMEALRCDSVFWLQGTPTPTLLRCSLNDFP